MLTSDRQFLRALDHLLLSCSFSLLDDTIFGFCWYALFLALRSGYFRSSATFVTFLAWSTRINCSADRRHRTITQNCYGRLAAFTQGGTRLTVAPNGSAYWTVPPAAILELISRSSREREHQVRSSCRGNKSVQLVLHPKLTAIAVALRKKGKTKCMVSKFAQIWKILPEKQKHEKNVFSDQKKILV